MNRRKIIEKLIRMTYDSLESHLKLTHTKECEVCDDLNFHRKCVVEYAHMIKLLTDLY